MGGRRSPAGQHAERINAAADLAEDGVLPAEAARLLAGRFAVSERQARRYVDQAAAGGRVPVPEATVVFTVKLPAALVVRVRARAREAGVTISALVAQALEEFLARGPRNHPRR
jgi:hypothetical protein